MTTFKKLDFKIMLKTYVQKNYGLLKISNELSKVLTRISSENFAILYSISGFTPPYHTGETYDDNISRKSGNVLKTLDPILITIIAMSALGVLLGAICGVVLYCACWHNGMSERNLSALENYNFELVDGVKLKKDKLNTQNSYSEAWRHKATGEVRESGWKDIARSCWGTVDLLLYRLKSALMTLSQAFLRSFNECVTDEHGQQSVLTTWIMYSLLFLLVLFEIIECWCWDQVWLTYSSFFLSFSPSLLFSANG